MTPQEKRAEDRITNNDITKLVAMTDEGLAKRSLKNEADYAHIMERYERRLMRYVMRLVSLTKEDAEEVVQDVFVKTYRNLNDFDPSLKFSSWIYRIAHNETVSRLRKMKARPQTVDAEDNEQFDRLTSEMDIERDLDRKYAAEVVRAAVDGLDQKYREVLVLRFLEEKDYKEISDILKKPLGTISVLLNRAKTKLKKELEQHERLKGIAF